MTDTENVSDVRRVFKVWIDFGVPGREIEEECVVEAGESADSVCHEAVMEMMAGHVDSGWEPMP